MTEHTFEQSREQSAVQTSERVLAFWFGRGDNAIEIAESQSSLWWGKDERVDAEIAATFAATARAVADGGLDHWADSPRGLLALIIATDQLPRNIHRDTPAAFACDATALRLAKHGVASGASQQLRAIERVFAYLPFEHSEALADQQRSVALYQQLADAAAPEEAGLFDNYLDFAHKHHDIIVRFDRFPHRNQILGRESTDAELAFLEQPGSSF
ncbi:MAG: DUF924 family protein [bacterium]